MKQKLSWIIICPAIVSASRYLIAGSMAGFHTEEVCTAFSLQEVYKGTMQTSPGVACSWMFPFTS